MSDKPPPTPDSNISGVISGLISLDLGIQGGTTAHSNSAYRLTLQ